jgi:hypothetical protein
MAFALAGCGSSDGPHGGHKISWYNKHTAAATKEAKWCMTHLVTVKHSNSAMNTCQAALHSTHGSKVMIQSIAGSMSKKPL